MDVGVFAFIQNEDKKVLLVKDASRHQLWTLPGGGVKLAELVTTTLEREVEEEASIKAKPSRLLGIFSQQKAHGIVILFEAKIESGTPAPDGYETSACEFFSLEEMLKMKDQIKPAQMSMVYQVLHADSFPIYNNFPSPEV